MITEHHESEQVQFPISEASQVAEVRRKVTALAGRAGLDETQAGICAVIASEMGTNLVKHAKAGEIFLRTVAQGSAQGLKFWLWIGAQAWPMSVALCRTAIPLPAAAGPVSGRSCRMATEFDIHSLPGRGTTLVARVWSKALPAARDAPTTMTGVINLAKPGESVSGDAWLSESYGRRTICAIVDGLGHGPLAAQAAVLAIESLREHREASLSEQIDFAHGALRSTRGAALGVAEILHDQGTRQICRHREHHGRRTPGWRRQEYGVPEWDPRSSNTTGDGVSVPLVRIGDVDHVFGWDQHPLGSQSLCGTDGRDPSLIAATLYRDFTRGRDDTTVTGAQSSGNGRRQKSLTADMSMVGRDPGVARWEMT